MLIAASIIHIISSIGLILSVLFQSGHKRGLGTISGGSDNYAANGKSNDRDAKLQKVTIVCAIIFVLATIALNIIVLNG